MEISTNIKDRILEIADCKGIKRDFFIESLNQKYCNYRGKSKLSSPSADVIVEISTKYSDVNIEWILTGKGSMLKSEIKEIPHVSSKSNIDYKAISKVQEELIEYKNKEIEALKRRVEDLEKFLAKPGDNKRKGRVSI